MGNQRTNDGTAANTLGHIEGSGGASASGAYSHAEGQATTATNTGSHAEGSSTISSGTGSHAEGTSTQATGPSSHAEGQATQATGNDSHAENFTTTASGNHTTARGIYAVASRYSQFAEGSGKFATNGDAQASRFVAMASTTNATATLLTGGGLAANYSGVNTNVYTMAAATASRLRITAIARRTDVEGSVASFAIDLTLARETGGNIRIVGSQLTSGSADAGASAWTLVASVDTTNQALVLTATGEAAKTIRWVAFIEGVEVG